MEREAAERIRKTAYCYPIDVNRRAILLFPLVILPLLIGGVIYIGWRPDNLVIGTLMNWPMLGELLPWLAKGIQSAVITPPPAVLYILPDLLWAFVLISLMGIIWFDEHSCIGRWLMASIPFAMLYELAQWIQWAPGTFDPYDLLGSALAALCSVIILDIYFKKGITHE